MAENLLTYILLGVIGVLGFMVVDEKYIQPQTRGSVEPDTVFVDKPYRVEVPEPQDQIIPATITMWETEYQEIQKLELTGDSVIVYRDTSSADLDPLFYDSRFLTNFPTAPKFLGLELDDDMVKFTGLTPSGETRSKTWSLDYAQNRYRIDPNGKGFASLTHDRKRSFLGFHFGFDQSLGVGTQWKLQDGSLNQDFYLKYNPEVQFRQNVSIESNIWISSDPFGSVGLNYQF